MTDKILEVRGLTKTYGGVKKKGAKQPTPTLDVLKGIDIDIYRGDVVCLIGPSGCGKSTFLRCLNRLEIPTSGSIKFEGVEVDDAHIDAVRQKMGMVFQHFNLFPHLTVKKNLELAPSLLKLKDKEAISQRADELLARVGLADKANVYPNALPVLPVSADDPHPANVPTANAAAKNILTAFFIIILLVCEANPILRSKIFPLSEERI